MLRKRATVVLLLVAAALFAFIYANADSASYSLGGYGAVRLMC